MKIGVISDTHGLLRPEVVRKLQGVDAILHLGDVGDAKILNALKEIAPLNAVRGNVDREGLCGQLPETDAVPVENEYLYLLHDLDALTLDPAAAKFAAVLYGHSHKARIWHHKDVLYFNPGSCGPRRFSLPVTMGFLHVGADSSLKAEIIPLEEGKEE